MAFWGNSKREGWQQFCAETNAEYIQGGFGSCDRVELKFQNWTIVLDTYVTRIGKITITHTRIRVPFINLSRFRFRLYYQGIFSEIAKFFGAQDIEIGSKDFDELFIIKSHDEHNVRKLLSNYRIQELIRTQPQINLQIKDRLFFWPTDYPEDVYELHFNVVGVIRDVARLKKLFDLFGEILISLVEAGIADDSDPGVSL